MNKETERMNKGAERMNKEQRSQENKVTNKREDKRIRFESSEKGNLKVKKALVTRSGSRGKKFFLLLINSSIQDWHYPIRSEEKLVLKHDRSIQGCQMVYFQTKNPNLGTFWRALKWKMLSYFGTMSVGKTPFGKMPFGKTTFGKKTITTFGIATFGKMTLLLC
jgi:hypothetical protein